MSASAACVNDRGATPRRRAEIVEQTRRQGWNVLLTLAERRQVDAHARQTTEKVRAEAMSVHFGLEVSGAALAISRKPVSTVTPSMRTSPSRAIRASRD